MVRRGKQRTPEMPLGVADITALPFGDRLFDVVWCRLVVGYVAELASVYRELSASLAPRLRHRDRLSPAAAQAGLLRSFRDAQGAVHVLENHVHEPAPTGCGCTRGPVLRHRVG